MIELPSTLAYVIVAYMIVDRIVRHFKQTDCDERIRAAVNEARRDAMVSYRNAYQAGLQHGCEDAHKGPENE